MKIELNSRVLFTLLSFVNKIPKEKLGDIDGNKYKPVTLRRKIAQEIKETLTDYIVKVDSAIEIFNETQKSVVDLRAELDAVEEKGKEEKEAEITAFAKVANDELMVKLNAIGKIVVFQEDGRTVLLVDDDTTAKHEFNDEQVLFLKGKIEEVGVDYFHFEEDLVTVASAFGVE